MSPSAPTRTHGEKKSLGSIYFAALIVGISSVLLTVLANQLVWDDVFFISANPDLGQPETLWAALAAPFWDNSIYQDTQWTHLWRPVTSFLIWLTAFLFGHSPWAFHALSLLCCVFASVSVGYLSFQLVDSPHPKEIAIGVACLFAIHPLSVEVLCMAVNISDHLAIGFLSGTLAVLIRSFRQGTLSAPSVFLIFGGALGACFSKEFGLLVAAAPLLAWMLARHRSPSIPVGILKSPMLWISCVLPPLLYLGLRQQIIPPQTSSLWGEALRGFDPTGIFLGVGHGFAQTVIPVSSGAHTYIHPSHILPWLASVGVVAALGGLALWNIKRGKPFHLSHMGLLAGTIGVIPAFLTVNFLGTSYRFPNRFLNVFVVGAVIAIIPPLAAKWKTGAQKLLPVFLLLLCLLSFVRISEWRTILTFTESEALHHPTDAFELLHHASTLLAAGQYPKARDVLQRAQTATDIHFPEHQAELYAYNAKLAAFGDNDPEKASALIWQALQILPSHLGFIRELADYRSMAGHPEESIAILKRACQSPLFSDAQKESLHKPIQFFKNRTRSPQTSATHPPQ